MLDQLEKEFLEAKVIVMFDKGKKTFRSELVQDYKANRKPMDEALRVQLDFIYQLTQAKGYPICSLDDFEADDLIGTLATQANEIGAEVVIATRDKDMCQLVNLKTFIFDPLKKTWLDSLGVEAKFGVKPQQFIDYLCLIGDASDNIKGADGIGPKTAVSLLKKFESLSGIYDYGIASVSAKQKTSLQELKTRLEVVQQLIRIRLDAPCSP